MPTILHPWVKRRNEQQVDTLRFLLQFTSTRDDRWILHTRETNGDLGYAEFLQEYLVRWANPIFIIEQDIVPTDVQLSRLTECYEAACVIPYRLRENQWSIWEVLGDGSWYFYEKGEGRFPEFVNNSALGFVKLSRRAADVLRKNMPIVRYDMLDYEISKVLTANHIMWHVHEGSVIHNRIAGDMR